MRPELQQGARSFAVGVLATPCANGETWEFRLTLGGRVVYTGPTDHANGINGVGVFRSVRVGDSIDAHAASALKELLGRNA